MNQIQALEALPFVDAISRGQTVQWRSTATRNLWADWVGNPSDPRLGDSECNTVQWRILTAGQLPHRTSIDLDDCEIKDIWCRVPVVNGVPDICAFARSVVHETRIRAKTV